MFQLLLQSSGLEMISIRRFVLGVVETNTYVIVDEDTREAIVVDPGDDSIELINFVIGRELKVKAVIATHGHFDHVLGVDFLRNKLGVEFYIHKLDTDIINLSYDWLPLFGLKPRKPPKPDNVINGDTVLKLGSIELKILHTPGHTPGSICIYIDKANAVFTGDTLFRGSVGRTDLPRGSEEDLRKSIEKIFQTLSLNTVVYPGHGSTTKLDFELYNNPYVRTLHLTR